MLSFFGKLLTSLLFLFFRPRQIRWGEVLVYMQKAGVEAFPILLTDFIPYNYAYSMSYSLANYAVKNGVVSEQQSRAWLDDLHQKQLDRAYFFSVNRFLFRAGKL